MITSIVDDIEGILRTLAQIHAMQESRREVLILQNRNQTIYGKFNWLFW